jgi:hypothetical protein
MLGFKHFVMSCRLSDRMIIQNCSAFRVTMRKLAKHCRAMLSPCHNTVSAKLRAAIVQKIAVLIDALGQAYSP